jgi:hypothetical protein
MKQIMKCPICKGNGEINFAELQSKKKKWVEVKRDMCRTLVLEGFSYRQVCKLMGYRSTRSVALAVKKIK